MITIQDHIKILSDAEKKQIIKEYEEYEKTGVTGNTLFRSTVESYIDHVKTNKNMFTLWAPMIILEVYRYFTNLMNEGHNVPMIRRFMNASRALWFSLQFVSPEEMFRLAGVIADADVALAANDATLIKMHTQIMNKELKNIKTRIKS
jgi:hypothetical protein